jgi:hypothetical protein
MGDKHVNLRILPMENREMSTSKAALLVISLFMPLILLSGCVSDAPFKVKSTTVPDQLNDGWEVALPEEVDINQEALDRIYAALVSEDRYFNAKSLLVIKDGQLVFET